MGMDDKAVRRIMGITQECKRYYNIHQSNSNLNYMNIQFMDI